MCQEQASNDAKGFGGIKTLNRAGRNVALAGRLVNEADIVV